MTEAEFREIVTEAIDLLPDEFKDHIKNVEIVVEDLPREPQIESLRKKCQHCSRYSLLGLYEGVPLNKRSVFSVPYIPDRITLFQKSIESHCKSREEMIDQIHRTFLHEIGHYFGLSDKRLRELGF